MKTQLTLLMISGIIFGSITEPKQAPVTYHPNTVNFVLGDVSFVEKYGHSPVKGTDENLRIRTHLEYVVDRLRAADADGLSDNQIQNRLQHIRNLESYIARDRFPSQGILPGQRKPCFVDDAGTACAVGYLMLQDGENDLVNRINTVHRFDYVKNMALPEILTWQQQSGLSVRELEMIQPSYFYDLKINEQVYVGQEVEYILEQPNEWYDVDIFQLPDWMKVDTTQLDENAYEYNVNGVPEMSDMGVHYFQYTEGDGWMYFNDYTYILYVTDGHDEGDLGVIQEIIDLNELDVDEPLEWGVQYWAANRLAYLDNHQGILIPNEDMIDILPENFGNLTGIEELYLSMNNLSELPESIGNLSNLRILDMDSNDIESLPESIGGWTAIEELKMQGNQIANLPESAENWTQLVEIDLSHNQIPHLPENIGNWSQVQRVYLNDNQIENLPESVENWTQLFAVDLSENQIVSVPSGIGNWDMAYQIFLNENHINEVHGDLCELDMDFQFSWYFRINDNQLCFANAPECIQDEDILGEQECVVMAIDEDPLPQEFKLFDPSPNPFNPSTVVQYQLPAATEVKLDLFDMNGRIIRSLEKGHKPAGMNQSFIDGVDLASGTYLVKIQSEFGIESKKVVLMK